MSQISITSKLTGVTNSLETSEITMNAPSIVNVKRERSDISSITRTNQDMVIALHDGKTLTFKNFYVFAAQGGNPLVFEGSDALGNGSHALTVTATDAAGNVSGATANFSRLSPQSLMMWAPLPKPQAITYPSTIPYLG